MKNLRPYSMMKLHRLRLVEIWFTKLAAQVNYNLCLRPTSLFLYFETALRYLYKDETIYLNSKQIRSRIIKLDAA